MKIVKNIPIPPRKKRALMRYNSKWSAFAERLKIGDSFLVANPGEASSLRSCLEKRGMKIASRTVEKGKTRVWRVK